jgi:pimeloyl-ACP methyl ester carboxylesterase
MSIRRYLFIGAAALLAAGLLAVVAPRAFAGAGGGPRPTIVLVHGAWADGSSWAAEVAALQAQGYTTPCQIRAKSTSPSPVRGGKSRALD